LTVRSFIAGAFFAGLCAVMDQYSTNVVHSSTLAIDHMAVAAIFLLFMVLVFLQIFLKFLRRFHFTEAELLGVYMMAFIGCTVVTMGLGSYFLATIAAPQYYANPQNRWADILWPHLRQWLMPQDQTAIVGYFEGISKHQPIPWGAWIKPIAAWLPFLLSLYLVMICIPIMMRRQWVDRERLLFPLAEVPIEMARMDERGFVLFRNKVMWFGFLLPFILSSLAALSRYYPMVPVPKIGANLQIFRHTQTLSFGVSWPVLGFIFLASTEVSFSLWFFALVTILLTGWFNIIGISSTENMGIYGSPNVIFNHIGTGALLTFVGYVFWTARSHLKDVFRSAFRNEPVDDSREILSYRTCALVILFGIAFMTGWLSLAGLPPLMAFLFVILALIIFIGVTRVVIEGGVPTLIAPGIASAQLLSSVGANALGPAGIASLGYTFSYAADIRTFVMSAAANSLKITDSIRENRRRIFWAMFIAVVSGLLTTIVVNLFICYRYGAINLNAWYFIAGPQVGFDFAKENILQPHGPNLAGWGNKLIGAVLMAAFLLMRAKFLWWPLHPIGWVVGSCVWVQTLWFSIFLAWLLKSVIMKYGGPKLYAGAKPFFFGIAIGQYVAATLWFVIDYFTGMKGNSIFWI